MKRLNAGLKQMRLVMLLAVILPAISLLAMPAVALAQAPAISEADYAMAAYTGMDPVSIAGIEAAQAKILCQGMSGAECDHSYVARTNQVAYQLGCPAILVDVGDSVGSLTFAGKILNAIGHIEYPNAGASASGVGAAAVGK